MRTLSFFLIAFFTAYLFRMDIATYRLAQIIHQQRDQIRFLGSILPVYCQLEKLNADFSSTHSDFTSYTTLVNTTARETLPELGTAIFNITPYSPESSRLKDAVIQLYQISSSETTKLNTLITNWKTSKNLWDYLVAAYTTYTFASDFEKAKSRLDESRRQVENATNLYITSLANELKTIRNENGWLTALYHYVLTEKDKAELKATISRQIADEIEANSSTNSACAKERLLEIQQLLTPQ